MWGSQPSEPTIADGPVPRSLKPIRASLLKPTSTSRIPQTSSIGSPSAHTTPRGAESFCRSPADASLAVRVDLKVSTTGIQGLPGCAWRPADSRWPANAGHRARGGVRGGWHDHSSVRIGWPLDARPAYSELNTVLWRGEAAPPFEPPVSRAAARAPDGPGAQPLDPRSGALLAHRRTVVPATHVTAADAIAPAPAEAPRGAYPAPP